MQQRSCPSCHQAVTLDAEICPWCRAELGDVFLNVLLARRYQPYQKLAEGFSGIVYEAYDLETQERRAIKKLKGATSEEARQRFYRECRVVQQLRHPLAVKIYQCEVDETPPWIAMELLQGTTLQQKIEQEGPLSFESFASLFAGLCDALTEAHHKGIIHRDLKPQHILLSDYAQPRMIDFGLATLRSMDTLTASDIIAGTPQYMAPEQWEGLHLADERSDIYSLGLIAYQCIMGRLPFYAETFVGWMQKHFYDEPEPIDAPHIPKYVTGAVHRALSKNPQDRQQTLDELRSELAV
jgi:serine/threonine protein kinase